MLKNKEEMEQEPLTTELNNKESMKLAFPQIVIFIHRRSLKRSCSKQSKH